MSLEEINIGTRTSRILYIFRKAIFFKKYFSPGMVGEFRDTRPMINGRYAVKNNYNNHRIPLL